MWVTGEGDPRGKRDREREAAVTLSSLGRGTWLALVAGGSLLLGGAPPARADFEIELQATVGGKNYSTTLTDNNTGLISYSTPSKQPFAGAFAVTLLSSSTNSPGDPSAGGEVDLSTLSITNTSGATQTLQVWITSTGFTAPGGANSLVDVSSSIGGTFTFGATGSDKYVYQVTADQSVGGGTDFGKGITLSPTTLTFTASGKKGKTSSFGGDPAGDQTGEFQRPASDPSYSLSSFSTITLTGGASVNFGGTITTVDPDPPEAPAPAGLVLVLTGGPPLGLVGWLRRRRRLTGDPK
jgi:hypothetical protein